MFRKYISFSFIVLFPMLLSAHGSHGDGIMAGFTHPILGIDHFVAILGVGILGYIINPSRWYLQIATFVLFMIIGGLLGINNEATLFFEKIIAFSVLAIGLFIAFSNKLNLILPLIVLSIFGFFHGFAHGAEMPQENTALKYITGYVLGALLVGTVGMLLTKLTNLKFSKETSAIFLGGFICGGGIVVLLA